MLVQELRISLQLLRVGRANAIAVIVEERVFHVLIKQLLVRHRRWRRLLLDWSGTVHGYARCCFLRSARTCGSEPIGNRIGRTHRLRPAGLDFADAIDGDVGRVLGLPTQLRALSGVDGRRVGGNRCSRRRWRWRGWWR